MLRTPTVSIHALLFKYEPLVILMQLIVVAFFCFSYLLYFIFIFFIFTYLKRVMEGDFFLLATIIYINTCNSSFLEEFIIYFLKS